MDLRGLMKFNLFSLQRGKQEPREDSDFLKPHSWLWKQGLWGEEKHPQQRREACRGPTSALREATSLPFTSPVHTTQGPSDPSIPPSRHHPDIISLTSGVPVSFNAHKTKHSYQQLLGLRSDNKTERVNPEASREVFWILSPRQFTRLDAACRGRTGWGQLRGSHTTVCSVLTKPSRISKHGWEQSSEVGLPVCHY